MASANDLDLDFLQLEKCVELINEYHLCNHKSMRISKYLNLEIDL